MKLFLKSSETILNGFDVLASLNLLYVLPKKIKEAGILLKMVIQRKTTVETLAGAISFFLNIFFSDISRFFNRLSCNKRNSENWYY